MCDRPPHQGAPHGVYGRVPPERNARLRSRPGRPSRRPAWPPPSPLVPDPRRQASVTYPLAALLAWRWRPSWPTTPRCWPSPSGAARQRRDLLARLGFPDGRAPCQSTLQRLFRRLDPDAVSAALSAHFAPTVAPDPAARGAQGVAIDGKAQRGRLQYQAGGCPVHALTAFCHDRGVVLAQEPIERGADKAEAELTVAPALLARVDWRGRVLTGDALFCQRALLPAGAGRRRRLPAAGQGEPAGPALGDRPAVRPGARRAAAAAAARPARGAHRRARPRAAATRCAT